MLKNENGMWVDQPEQLKDLITNYFMNLFGYTPSTSPTNWNNLVSCKLDQADNATLTNAISNDEVWNAVKNINAFKAPGRDGFQAVFFHTYWSIVGASILRPLLGKIVRPNQSSFIPGRNTSDNIIITQEIIHSLNKKKGKKGGLVFKIDLEKAYDNLSWDFLKQTLEEFNFDHNFIELIMYCVTTVSSAVIWDGVPLQEFIPARGLRQGDPLSPYLYVLCLERLSNMISFQADHKTWKGVETSRKGPKLTHLFFADDLMLFGQATSNCSTIMKVMNEFCDIPGLKINHHKSKLFVSPNIERRSAKEMSNKTGIPLTSDLGRYLGVPIIHGRVNRGIFTHILDKMQRRLAGWKAYTLSMVGRATLIQSVPSAIPAYAMQTVLLPAKVCNEIDSMNRNFLWGDTLEKKKIRLVNWDVVCKMKKAGGLGIKKARDQNLALISKLGWNLIRNRNSLWCEQKGRDASHIWRDGNWDAILINDNFPQPLANIILGTPPPGNSGMDTPFWKGSPGGEFTVSSVYEMLQNRKDMAEDWSWVWKLRLPQKLKGRLKLNTDGSKKIGGDGGFGGLIRDEHGAWVCGYYERLQPGTSLEAELWALYKGLTVILQKGMDNVTIELDTMQVVQLMNEETRDNCPFKNLVEDSKILLQGCQCTVQHVWKEGNLCADALAKFGAQQPKDMLVVNEPPAEIRSLLISDMIALNPTAINSYSSGAIPASESAVDYMKSVEEQFIRTSKSLASTLMIKVMTMKYDGLSGVREHILKMASQLKKDKRKISELIAMCVQEEERFKVEKPNIAHLTILGPTKKIFKKGKERSKGFRFYCPIHSTRIVETRNDVFLENEDISGRMNLKNVSLEEKRAFMPSTIIRENEVPKPIVDNVGTQ
ncbi:uncharacterized protein LOC114282098 [Camellia sinensis]|uniref:uncharacterized protein LOC114282098 n=1 Tax=Camellia sinensis TaxID=4442 RepID=UPI0010357D26|nr:uncharacterized protein LOC114282098 [Camellia sinensis]